ncbi:hypothetical protein [Tessaracoccus rhinocerotis]|nr:hypothetical protein [Tessaracoccus rhinocerotis]
MKVVALFKLKASEWDLAEMVEVTSVEEFERDNAELPGREIADA